MRSKINEVNESAKATWSTPEVVAHGSIESITGWTGSQYSEMFCGPGRNRQRWSKPQDQALGS